MLLENDAQMIVKIYFSKKNLKKLKCHLPLIERSNFCLKWKSKNNRG